MTMEPLKLIPATIPEWDDVDEMEYVLSSEVVEKADEAECKKMLDAVRLEFPKVDDLPHVKLLQYAQQHETPLSEILPADIEHYDFYLVELPINILTPNQRLTRLRVTLTLELQNQQSANTVAYDLFPKDQTDVKEIMNGGVKLDLSQALKFVLNAGGAGPATALADALDIKIEIPLKWTSATTTIKTTDRLSNPVEWDITDNAIQNGFTGYVIIQAPKDAEVSIAAELVGELRKTGLLGKILKVRYRTDARNYLLRR